MKVFTLFCKFWGLCFFCTVSFFTFSHSECSAVGKYITIQYDANGGQFHGYVDSAYQEIEQQPSHQAPSIMCKENQILTRWIVDSVNGKVLRFTSTNPIPIQIVKGDTILIKTTFVFEFDEESDTLQKDSLYIRLKAEYTPITSNYVKVNIIPFVDRKENGMWILDTDTPYVYVPNDQEVLSYVQNLRYGGLKSPSKVDFKVNKDTTIYVEYEPYKYAIKYILTDDSTDLDTALFGETITPPILPDTDFIFKEWSPTFTGFLPQMITSDGDNDKYVNISYTAQWLSKDSLHYKNKGGNYHEYKVFFYQCDTNNTEDPSFALLIDSFCSAAHPGSIELPTMQFPGFVTPAPKQVNLTPDDSTWTYFYKREEYTIQWNANQGEFANHQTLIEETYTNGKKLKIIAQPTREGFIFDHWETQKQTPNSSTYVLDITNENFVTGYQTYIACWKEKTRDFCPYTVYHLLPKLENDSLYDTLIVKDSVLEDTIFYYPLYDTVGFVTPILYGDSITKDSNYSCTYIYTRLKYELRWENTPNADDFRNVSVRIIPTNYSIAGWYKYGEPLHAPDSSIIDVVGYNFKGWEEKGKTNAPIGSLMPAYNVTYVPILESERETYVYYKVNYTFQTPFGDYKLKYTQSRKAKNGSTVEDHPLAFKYYASPSSITHTLTEGGNNDITFVYNYSGSYEFSWSWDTDLQLDESETPRGLYSENGNYQTGTYLMPPKLKERAGSNKIFNGWIDEQTNETFNGIMPNKNTRYIAQKISKADIETKKVVPYIIRMQFQQMNNDRTTAESRYASRQDKDVDIIGFYKDTVLYTTPNVIIEVEGREFQGFSIQEDDYSAAFSGNCRRVLRKIISQDTTTIFTFKYIRNEYDLQWNFNKPSDISSGDFSIAIPDISSYTHTDTLRTPYTLITYGHRITAPQINDNELQGYKFKKWETEPDSLMPAHSVFNKALWTGDPKIDTSSNDRYCAGATIDYPLLFMDYVKDIKIEFSDSSTNELFRTDNEEIGEFTQPVLINNKKYASFVIPQNGTYGKYPFTISFRDEEDSIIKTDTAAIYLNFNNSGILQISEYALVVNDNLWKNLFDTTTYTRQYIWTGNGITTTQSNDDNPYNSNFYVSTLPLDGNYECSCLIFDKSDPTKTKKAELKFCAKYVFPKINNSPKKLYVTPRIVQNTINVTINNPTQNNHTLQIFSVLGSKMYHKTFQDNQTTVDMSSFPTGEYLIRVDGESLVLIKE